MSKKTLAIHSENILPIIKQWLYSDRDIFVRELISNACDAIEKVKLLGQEEGEKPFRIDVKVDKEAKTLTFSDNGIGMTAEEVEKYIAQIAFSGAEDFVKRHEKEQNKDAFIGHFGLGFYSSYMVASNVTIDTLSYQEGAEPAYWTCDGSAEYELSKGKRTERGTTITLTIDEENSEFLEESQIRQVLQRYCAYLPRPIYLNDTHINTTEPLWVKPATECTDDDYRTFFRHLYPTEREPLFWVHLQVDYPFHLQGILYFPKLTRDFDQNKSTIQLYSNRVFVDDNCKGIIPSYLNVLKGVIDSPDIPLNVSRSTLQMDRTVRQLAGHIAKKVSDSLATLHRTDESRFFSCWEDISPLVKLGAIEDSKFYDRVKPLLFWKDTEGNWQSVEQYLEKNREKTGDKVYYARFDHTDSPMVAMYRDKEIDVLVSSSPIDNFLINFLEGKITPAKFQRVDGALDENLLDKEREQNLLDEEGKTVATRLAESIRSLLSLEDVEVEAKSLASDALPGFLVLDESQRRMRDYFAAMSPDGNLPKGMLGKTTFVVNTNSPLVNALPKLQSHDPELAKELASEVYDLARLSQREMQQEDLTAFVSRTNAILQALAERCTSE